VYRVQPKISRREFHDGSCVADLVRYPASDVAAVCCAGMSGIACDQQ